MSVIGYSTSCLFDNEKIIGAFEAERDIHIDFYTNEYPNKGRVQKP